MHPIINFGFIQMPSYGLVILLGFIVAVPIAMTLAEKYDYHKLDILLSTILAAVGMIVFAKIIYIANLIYFSKTFKYSCSSSSFGSCLRTHRMFPGRMLLWNTIPRIWFRKISKKRFCRRCSWKRRQISCSAFRISAELFAIFTALLHSKKKKI